ncbi:MAG TPA: hypothetical protein DEP57_00220, partial [Selenomonas sp.]|nr:hypothetical protein [Selenomonas sp.]
QGTLLNVGIAGGYGVVGGMRKETLFAYLVVIGVGKAGSVIVDYECCRGADEWVEEQCHEAGNKYEALRKTRGQNGSFA